jgi:acetyl-CoA acyltransferase 1
MLSPPSPPSSPPLLLLLRAGLTAENVAEQFHVAREVEDKVAAASHAKAAKAQAEGKFKDEIVPVETVYVEPTSGACGLSIIC